VIQAKITALSEFTPKTIFIGYLNANFLANFQKSRPLATNDTAQAFQKATYAVSSRAA